jgi:hypothetical protein
MTDEYVVERCGKVVVSPTSHRYIAVCRHTMPCSGHHTCADVRPRAPCPCSLPMARSKRRAALNIRQRRRVALQTEWRGQRSRHQKLTVMGRGLHPREYRVAGIRVRPRDHRKRDPMRKGLRVGLSSVSWEGSSRSLLCPRSRVMTAIIGTIGAVGGGYIGRAIDVVPRRRAGRLPPGRGGAVGLLLAYRPFRRRPARLRPRPNAACAAWALGVTWLSIDRRLKSPI